MSLMPQVLWAQRPTLVLVTIALQDSKDVVLRLLNDTLFVSCVSEGKPYEVSLPLFAAVSAEESSFVARPRHIEIRIAKKDPSWWPRLPQSKVKYAQIQLDWNRWQDEDEVDDENVDVGDFGMGGLAGMDEEEMRQKLRESGDEDDDGNYIGDSSGGKKLEKNADDEDEMPPLSEE
eukprot:PhF_6_TR5510/c2_g1_i5/m.7811